MAQTIRLKRSATAGSVPTTGQLALGEVAINTNDGRVFTKVDDGTAAVVEISMLNNGEVQKFTSDVEVRSNGYLKLPVGTTAQRDSTPEQGQVRYNTSLNTFEGYSGSSWGSLGGVIDTPQTTYALSGVSGNTSLPHTGTANTLTFVNNSVLAGTWNSTLFDVNTALNVDGAFTTTGNSTIGNAAADTLTVNATSTFNAPVTIANGQTFTANGNTVIGNASTDTMTVNATSTFQAPATFNGNVTIGDAATDTLTVTATATFAEKVTMSKGFSIPSGQPLTFNGLNFTNANKFTILNSAGTIIFGGWVLDTDANTAN